MMVKAGTIRALQNKDRAKRGRARNGGVGGIAPSMRPFAEGDDAPVPHRGCQWIEGEPKDRQFCGKKTVNRANGDPSPWCADHLARVYRAPSDYENKLAEAAE